MPRQVFFLDLKSEDLSAEYAAVHSPGRVPAGVIADIVGANIVEMQIFALADRLVMITETIEGADAGARVASADSEAWEARMSRFQQPIGDVPEHAKWQPGTMIFNLHDHISKDCQK